ncbi:MAG: hypothetical protein OXG38_05755 [Chloroflexi bacterium]|nr:hypothetical protein [Chloroflexota bacterium]
MDLAEAAALLDKIAEEQCHPFKIASEFRERADNSDDDVVRIAAAALEYSLLKAGSERRETYGPFAPLAETAEWVTPPYTWDVKNDMLAAWGQLVELVQSPVVVARLRDLLWVTRFGEKPHEHAIAAIGSYLSATELPHCEGLESFSFLDRALDLSREIKVPGVAKRVGQLAAEELVAEHRRRGPDPRPGVIIRLLTLLVDLPADDRPRDLHARLEEAHVVFAGSFPDHRVALFQLQERLARGDQEEIDRLRKESAKLWIWWADQQDDGWLRQHALLTALEFAKTTKTAADMRDDIRRMIEQIDPDDLPMESFEVETKVSRLEIEKLIDHIVGHDGIGPALDRFGRWWPPTGDSSSIAAAAEAEFEGAVILRHVRQAILGKRNRPIRHLECDDDKRKWAIAQRTIMATQSHAILAHMALRGMYEAYNPSQEELAALFQTELIDADRADVFARALHHYWADRYDESIHIALPRIEGVLRSILGAIGGVTYIEPRGRQFGGEKTLGVILGNLCQFLPDEWLHPLRFLLINRFGLNLRNDYAHDLMEYPLNQNSQQQDAALVLNLAAHLRLFPFPPRSDSDEKDG